MRWLRSGVSWKRTGNESSSMKTSQDSFSLKVCSSAHCSFAYRAMLSFAGAAITGRIAGPGWDKRQAGLPLRIYGPDHKPGVPPETAHGLPHGVSEEPPCKGGGERRSAVQATRVSETTALCRANRRGLGAGGIARHLSATWSCPEHSRLGGQFLASAGQLLIPAQKPCPKAF